MIRFWKLSGSMPGSMKNILGVIRIELPRWWSALSECSCYIIKPVGKSKLLCESWEKFEIIDINDDVSKPGFWGLKDCVYLNFLSHYKRKVFCLFIMTYLLVLEVWGRQYHLF